MKDSTKEALFKFGEFCDSGKPWYCFFGVYLVTLIVNITLLLTSEQKPKWWSVALDVWVCPCGMYPFCLCSLGRNQIRKVCYPQKQ